MARRQIGQETFGFAIGGDRRRSSLDELSSLIGWLPVEDCLAVISCAAKDENDGKAGPQALPDDPGEVFADSACRATHFGDAMRAKDGTPRIVATGMWGRDEVEIRNRLDA